MPIKYKKGYKYQLYKDYIYDTGIKHRKALHDYITLFEDGKLLIKKGYAWDGASGPAVDSKNFLRGSLVHDALYQLISCGQLVKTLRKPADKILYKICREDGMSWFRAKCVLFAVNTFGSLHISARKIHTAP